MIEYLKLKALEESARAQPAERIRARIIMTHKQSIINLACIIRKHESSHVIKVLLAVLLSSLCPRALSALPAHCWSFTERALIYAAAWLLTYCLYVQSWLIMKSFRRKENEWIKLWRKYRVKFDSDKGFSFKLNYFAYFMIWWTASVSKLIKTLHRSVTCEGNDVWLLLWPQAFCVPGNSKRPQVSTLTHLVY